MRRLLRAPCHRSCVSTGVVPGLLPLRQLCRHRDASTRYHRADVDLVHATHRTRRADLVDALRADLDCDPPRHLPEFTAAQLDSAKDEAPECLLELAEDPWEHP